MLEICANFGVIYVSAVVIFDICLTNKTVGEKVSLSIIISLPKGDS